MIKFQGTNHSFHIVGMNILCTFRIYLSKFFVKVVSTFLFGKTLQLLPVGSFLLSLSKINIPGNRLYIKSCSSYQNRDFSLCVNLFHGSLGHFLKFHNMKFVLRFQYIYQIMCNSLHLFLSDLGRTDVHSFIDLHGIGRDDLSVHCLRQRNGETCFSCCCRTCQHDQWLFH